MASDEKLCGRDEGSSHLDPKMEKLVRLACLRAADVDGVEFDDCSPAAKDRYRETVLVVLGCLPLPAAGLLSNALAAQEVTADGELRDRLQRTLEEQPSEFIHPGEFGEGYDVDYPAFVEIAHSVYGPKLVRLRIEKAELEAVWDVIPCGSCDDTGIMPSERWGRDEDGAPYSDEDEPCPKGCQPSSKLPRLRESIDKLRAELRFAVATRQQYAEERDGAQASVRRLLAEVDQAAEALRKIADRDRWERDPSLLERVEFVGSELDIAREAWQLAAVLLKTFVDSEPCRLDHHGYCQEHGWLQEGVCNVRRARAFLAALPDHVTGQVDLGAGSQPDSEPATWIGPEPQCLSRYAYGDSLFRCQRVAGDHDDHENVEHGPTLTVRWTTDAEVVVDQPGGGGS